MATVLSVFVRAYTQVSSSVAGTLVAAPRNAATGVSSALWRWWDDGTTAPSNSLVIKSGIATAAARRIVSAVRVQQSGALVAQVVGHADPSGAWQTATDAGADAALDGEHSAHESHRATRSCSPCSKWTLFCGRRPARRRDTGAESFYSHVQHARGNSTDTSVGPAATGAQLQNMGRCVQHMHHARRLMLPAAPRPQRLVVYLKKRPVYGTEWSRALTLLGQDHVGVVVAPTPCVQSSSGSLAATLDDVSEHRWHMEDSDALAGPAAFDFGPVDGKDFSIFKVTQAEIRRDKFDAGESALVATTARTMEDIEAFNAAYAASYHLGVSDCRDYAAALVLYLTGVAIRPSDLAHYITSSRARSESDMAAKRGNSGCGTGDAADDSSPRKGGWLSLPSMHNLVSGASVPFHVGLGL